jgi:hypothetical protein
METLTVIRRRSACHSLPNYYRRPNACTRYVAKIIFTYILGYKVDVGHMEAVNLISSPKYSEKQIVGTLMPPKYPPFILLLLRDTSR